MRSTLPQGQRKERSQWSDRTDPGTSSEVAEPKRPSPAKTWLLRVAAAVLAFTAPVALVYGYQRVAVQQKTEQTRSVVAEQQRRAEAKTAEAALRQQRCLARRDEVMSQAGLPGTPELEEKRIELLVRVKAEPTVFVRRPEFDPDVPKATARLREGFETTKFPSNFLSKLANGFVIHPENGRAMLLREGYLYAEDFIKAQALMQRLGAQHLFSDERIWIQRGESVYHARRTPARKYVFEDGPLQGKEAYLLMFDRLGTGTPPPPLHRDFRSLRYRLHFDRADVVHMTESHVVADLHYGGMSIPTVLKSEGARLEVECEAVPPEAAHDLSLYRDRGQRKQRVVQALRSAMLAQIDEQLPFDEPYREWGQQDGVLRYKWRDAYFSGQSKFDLNDDTYYVYDPEGHPKVPQVCVDFLTDTLERASGTWWQPKDKTPQRVVGNLNLNTLALENHGLRRVPGFVELARSKPEWFDVYDTPPEEQIPFWRHEEFYAYVFRNAHRFVPGDIVVIRGYTNFERKWEQRVMHYHSFFIYESDPITAMPIAIVGNAGRPELRVWDTEARRTPRRAIWHRLRPSLYWLEKNVDPKMVLEAIPAPLFGG